MAVYHVLDYSFANNYPVLILYFALEDQKKKIFKNLMCHYLKKRHNYNISLAKLESKSDFILPESAEKLIIQDSDFYYKINKHLYIMEDCITPNEIEKRCDDIKEKIKDPNTHVIVIVDNYANLVPDAGESDWDAVRRFSRNIVRIKLCKEYNWTAFGILQQDFRKSPFCKKRLKNSRNCGKVFRVSITNFL